MIFRPAPAVTSRKRKASASPSSTARCSWKTASTSAAIPASFCAGRPEEIEMEVGVLLVDTPRAMPAREQLDLALRQLEWGQEAGVRVFMLAQHWGYGPVTILQPVPFAARLSANLAPQS